jgi:succinate dehydrogenase / fumarate reductase cytochrome b subunit
MSQPNAGSARPLSPHLDVWRWHVTMLASILHRASGVGLYGGAVLVVLWLIAAAAGPQCYGLFAHLGSSVVGLILWIGLTWAAFYHLFSGARHLVWDTGAGLTKEAASMLARLSIWASVLAVIAFWAWLFVSHHVVFSGKVLL